MRFEQIPSSIAVVTDRGEHCAALRDGYSRQLEAENVGSVLGYVHTKAFNYQDASSFSVQLKAPVIWQSGQKERPWKANLETVSLQFDTSDIEILEMIEAGLTENQILGSGFNINTSLAIDILGFVLGIVTLIK